MPIAVTNLTALVTLAWSLAASAPSAGHREPEGGVVVIGVSDEAATKAGLQPGDVLRAWTPGWVSPDTPPGPRAIESPLDVEQAEEQGVRGPITLLGSRAGLERTWRIAPGSWHRLLSRNVWGLDTRPALRPELLGLVEEGRALAASGSIDIAAGRFCVAHDTARSAGERELSTWLLLLAARTLAGRSPAESDPLYAKVVEAVPGPFKAPLLLEWATTFQPSYECARADMLLERAEAASQQSDPDGLGVASSYFARCRCARFRGDFTEYERVQWLALGIRERLAPGSLAVAENLASLALVRSFNSDLDSAEAFSRRALDIMSRLSPHSRQYSWALGGAAFIAEARGDYSTAEQSYRRVLEIAARLPSPELTLGQTIGNLGVIASKRGEVAESEELYRQALAQKEKAIPRDENTIGITLLNLAQPVRLRGATVEAEQLVRRAIAIFEKGSPESPQMAAAYHELSDQLLLQGDLTEAERLQSRALAIRAKTAAGSLSEADSHQALAILLQEEGRLEDAQESAQRALTIREKRAPGSTVEAETLYELGRTRRRLGDAGGAADLLCRAVEALETQRGRLGGTQETRAAFATKFADVYRAAIELLIELGQPEDAFRLLERSRARAFLSMLAARDIAFSADIPRELAEESKTIAREYDRVMAQVGSSSGSSAEALKATLRELRRRSEESNERIRALSPRLATLRDPVALGVTATQAVLDPGTTFLSYSVGNERTTLFVLSRETPLRVISIDIPRDELGRRVDRFRRLIDNGRAADPTERLVDAGRALFHDLLGPAAGEISASRRLLVSPDGPLHRLPFAALVTEPSKSTSRRGEFGVAKRPGKRRRRGEFVAEWKPVHTILSATVYAELRRARSSSPAAATAAVALAAFGNPTYPRLDPAESRSIADRELRSAMRKGFNLEPLPATETEVTGIVSLYGSAAHAYLGADATEEQAKALGKEVRSIHFACHALLDEELPLNSALALSTGGPGHENGLLQAWEVLDTMRLDADLVTLSACETALGQESGGEGLVGLTRAFQYAGARTVLASLWRVDDESTQQLMTRFYSHLKAGKTKDEALRSAQLELIRAGGKLANPFAWAAFQLTGDWR